MRTHRLLSSFALLPLLVLAACDGWNYVETGERGKLTFTPDECGRASGCDLDDAFVVGGAVTVSLDSVDSAADVHNVTLISSNFDVVDVWLEDDGDHDSKWRVNALRAGYAELIAIDQYGYEIDWVEIEVRRADRLELDLVNGEAVGATSARPGYDEVWTIAAGQRVTFEAAARRSNTSLMGEVTYDVVIDEVLLASQNVGADITHGRLDFDVPAGEYGLELRGADGMLLRVLFIAQ
jgi:hypothetical protein